MLRQDWSNKDAACRYRAAKDILVTRYTSCQMRMYSPHRLASSAPQQTQTRCHRHPHGVQVRRTTEQLAKANPPLTNGRWTAKRCLGRRQSKRLFAML